MYTMVEGYPFEHPDENEGKERGSGQSPFQTYDPWQKIDLNRLKKGNLKEHRKEDLRFIKDQYKTLYNRSSLLEILEAYRAPLETQP